MRDAVGQGCGQVDVPPLFPLPYGLRLGLCALVIDDCRFEVRVEGVFDRVEGQRLGLFVDFLCFISLSPSEPEGAVSMVV